MQLFAFIALVGLTLLDGSAAVYYGDGPKATHYGDINGNGATDGEVTESGFLCCLLQ